MLLAAEVLAIPQINQDQDWLAPDWDALNKGLQ